MTSTQIQIKQTWISTSFSIENKTDKCETITKVYINSGIAVDNKYDENKPQTLNTAYNIFFSYILINSSQVILFKKCGSHSLKIWCQSRNLPNSTLVFFEKNSLKQAFIPAVMSESLHYSQSLTSIPNTCSHRIMLVPNHGITYYLIGIGFCWLMLRHLISTEWSESVLKIKLARHVAFFVHRFVKWLYFFTTKTIRITLVVVDHW